MDQPGRKSADNLAVVPVIPSQRAVPPSWMPEAHAEVWRATVSTKPPEWFREDVHPVLEAYCAAVVEHRRVALAISQTTPGDKEYQDLCAMLGKLAGTIKNTATTMRLTPQSRYTPQAAATAQKKTAALRSWERPTS